MRIFLSKCRRLFYVLRHSRLDAWVLRGRELSTGEPFCIAYVGTTPLKNYYADLAFGGEVSEKHLGKCWPLLFRFLIALFYRDCSLIVFEVIQENEPLTRFLGPTLRNPVWMRMEMKVSGDLESSMRKSRYRRIKKQIEKAGFSYEIRTDEEAFEDFYYKIYLPSVESRHGDAGLVVEYEALKKRYKKGEILMLKLGEERIGGALVDFSKEKPRFMTLGVRDGSPEYFKMGAASAMYYFQFLRILELGGATVNLGSSRGFLKDRPLMFKVTVGGYVANFHIEEAGYLHFKICKITPALKSFLINNPFFMRDQDGKYWASIFVHSVQSVPDSVRDLIKEFSQEFVSPKIYTFDPPEYLRENAAAIKTLLEDVPVESAYSVLP